MTRGESRSKRGHRRGPGRVLCVSALSLGGLLLASCGPQPQGVSHTASSSTTTVDSTTTTTTFATATTTRPNSILPAKPLSGKVVGIDPGHNGLNYTNPSFLTHQVFNGRTEEDCDTTGTETASGYTEALYNFNVAMYLRTDLLAEGARVVMTRTSNSGVGPCIDRRAHILNAARSNVAIDIHADGGPVSGRGFAILEPVADGPNDAVIAKSEAFGLDVRSRFRAITGMPFSTYDGTNAINFRSDLAGLNLTTVPKVLIECGNMQNPADAALLESTTFQERAALALAAAITDFLR